MSDYRSLSALHIAKAVRERERSAAEVAAEALSRARTEGTTLNAFLSVCDEKAKLQAEQVDALVSSGKGDELPLAGVPIALKDNISYTGYPCTCASRILENYVPPYDATVVTRLLNVGAVVIGKTNMDEFAMGSSTENSAFGPVKNPHDHKLAPGGSSGGSAAVVAAGICPLSFGSETGGSVRQPASFCGIVGLKPTYGGVSRYGLVSLASSTDQISPFARTVEEIALLYGVVAGHDPCDSTSAPFKHPDYSNSLREPRTFTIGIPKEYFTEGIDPAVRATIDRAIGALTKAGHKLVDISIPHTDKGIAIYYVIMCAEASANLARFDGVKYGLRVSGDQDLFAMYSDTRARGFGRETARRIMLGTYTLSAGYYDAYYVKASQVRELLRRDFEAAFQKVDLIISPTAPTPPFRLGEKIDDPLAMYLSDVYTVSASLTGVPAISIPYGNAPDGRPIGVQFMAPWFGEQALFQAGYQLEQLR